MNLNKHHSFLSMYANTKFKETPNLGKTVNFFNIVNFVIQLATIIRDIIMARMEDRSRIRQLEIELEMMKQTNQIKTSNNEISKK